MADDTWREVRGLLRGLVKEAAPLHDRLRKALTSLKRTHPAADLGYHRAFLNPRTRAVFFSLSDSDTEDREEFRAKVEAWRKSLAVPGVSKVIAADGTEMQPPKDDGPWLTIKAAGAVRVADVLGPPARAFGLGADRPALVNLLAGAALTGAAGYGLGWLGEKVLPRRYFDPGRLRKTLAAVGLGLGAIPGLVQVADNLSQNTSPLAPWPQPSVREELSPPKAAAAGDTLLRLLEGAHALLDDLGLEKAAWGEMTAGAIDHIPLIDRDAFGRVVWMDAHTPVATRTAVMGLVESAGLASGDHPVVSPADVARVAIGAGAGWLSGAVVGRTLGALAGLRPETQETLQRAGVWAGVLRSVVPLVFGR